jgi:hypothetical protein
LKRLDLFLDRNYFSQLFNRQDLQWYHYFAQGAPPTGFVSSHDALRPLGPRAGPDRRQRASPLDSALDFPRRADCELSIPLERLRLETRRLRSPKGAPFINFQIRRPLRRRSA